MDLAVLVVVPVGQNPSVRRIRQETMVLLVVHRGVIAMIVALVHVEQPVMTLVVAMIVVMTVLVL